MVQAIPGFYYDEEKKKYFKIQANHAAPPGSQYSKDSVKRKREDQEEHRRKTTLAQRMAIERIVPARSLHDPLQRIHLEIGSQNPSGASIQQQIARAYTGQLKLRSLCQFSASWSNSWRPDQIRSLHALREPNNGTLIIGGNAGSCGQLSICLPDREDGKWTYQPGSDTCLVRMRSNLSSVSLDHNGILLSTFDTGPSGEEACVWVHSLGVQSIFPPSHIPMPARVDPRASAAHPSGDKALFAIGAIGGIYMLEGRGGGWEMIRKNLKPRRSKNTGVCSVDWMSPNVVACGERTSAVYLYDIRSDDCAARLRHGRSVNKIRRVGEHRIVVAGDDMLHMYDLRFAPAATTGQPSTRPSFTFPGYSPSLFPDLDVSPELNVLVTTSRKNDFQLWSLHKGVEIPAPRAASTRYRGRRSPISVGFEAPGDAPSQYGADAPSLLVGSSNTVDQWIW